MPGWQTTASKYIHYDKSYTKLNLVHKCYNSAWWFLCNTGICSLCNSTVPDIIVLAKKLGVVTLKR